MKEKKNKFLQGALILAGANFLVKIIGALFKVPLRELVGDDGMGIFNVAYQIYTFMFIVATAGFPIAVSKMVAESIAKGDEYDAKRIFHTAVCLLGVIGLVGSVLLFVFADNLAAMLGNNDSALCIKVISPGVFFVSLVSAYRGYFQGKQNMYPTAGSEVVEAGAKLAIGYVAAAFFMGMVIKPAITDGAIDFVSGQVGTNSAKTMFSASGAIFGVSAGTFLALVLMAVIYAFKDGRKKVSPLAEVRSRGEILKKLIKIAVPITIGASVSSLTSLVDLGTIMNRLVVNPAVFEHYSHLFAEGTEFARNVAEEGWTGGVLYQKMANTLYGAYTGQAQTMFNLPLTIVVGLSMSIVPAISAALAKKDNAEAQTMTQSIFRITTLFALPCAVGFFVLSSPILKLLYSDANAGSLLQNLAYAVPFVALVSVSNSVLQSYGKVYYPVINMLIGGLVKVLMNYFLIPVWGIDAAPIATAVCYGMIALLNLGCIVFVLKVKISIKDTFLKPLFAALVMGAIVALLYNRVSGFMPDSRIVTIGAIGVGAVVYLVAVLLIRALKRDDVLNMPKGEKLASIMTKFKLL